MRANDQYLTDSIDLLLDMTKQLAMLSRTYQISSFVMLSQKQATECQPLTEEKWTKAVFLGNQINNIPCSSVTYGV